MAESRATRQRANASEAALKRAEREAARQAAYSGARRGRGKPLSPEIEVVAEDIAPAIQVPYGTVTPDTPRMLRRPATLADVGVPEVTARGAIDNARRDVNANVAMNEATQRINAAKQQENLRRQLGTLDLNDVNAMRAAIQASADKQGLPPMSGAVAVVDKIEQARRAAAQNALRDNDTNANYLRDDVRAQRALDETMRVSGLNTMTDVDKAFNKALSDSAAAMTKEQKQVADTQINMLMAAKARLQEQAQPGADIGMGIVPSSGNYVQPYAEGGEVDVEYEVEMDMPEAVPTGPMQMDSGDYIIPVEAMRFYGRKFFQDLINKAEDEG
jgi:hypothetical protein